MSIQRYSQIEDYSIIIASELARVRESDAHVMPGIRRHFHGAPSLTASQPVTSIWFLPSSVKPVSIKGARREKLRD